ncbi:unnamed protein product [Aphanomyces euteiches]|uniref:Choloylglycine hydrolase/NAAA C-terminal domain-containing protein n=1 Tax=Aphanomyces euteiches TaxID=100861 RepID=A0A6G0WWH1_9STRA|nr:hypothetical protein Ae201684_010854 [Aphanomyces euteiches]KAH9061596.1 hypothetical protein Ae201684P_020931 [Aphanomyces euteiches]
MRASWFFLAGLTVVQGCSDFLLNATSQVVSARTMDFFVDLRTVVEIVPRDTLVQESIVKGCPDCADYAWRTKYGFVALNSFGYNVAADGLNEKGLSAATLFLPGSQYPTPDATDAKTRPMVTSLVTYILGNYANVEEVKAGLLHDIQVVEGDPGVQVIADQQAAVHEDSYPLHFPVHDAAGKSIVVEFLNGTVNVYDNPAGVLTNEPPFLEQLALVAAHDKAHGTLDKTFLGGYTPVERFQRLTFLNHHTDAKFIANTTYSTATPDQAAISQAVHLISTVRIPTAYVKDGEATEYTLVRDHQNRRLFFQSNENQVLRRVDLDKIDFKNSSNRRAINVTYGDWSVDVTDVLLHSTASTIDIPSRSTIERLIHANSQPAAAITGTVAASELHHASFWMGLGVGVGGSAIVAAFVAARVYGRKTHDYVRLP